MKVLSIGPVQNDCIIWSLKVWGIFCYVRKINVCFGMPKAHLLNYWTALEKIYCYCLMLLDTFDNHDTQKI